MTLVVDWPVVELVVLVVVPVVSEDPVVVSAAARSPCDSDSPEGVIALAPLSAGVSTADPPAPPDAGSLGTPALGSREAGSVVIPVEGSVVIPVEGSVVIPVEGSVVIPVEGSVVIPVDGRVVIPVVRVLEESVLLVVPR
ncbi:hypothetical protein [Actinomycetospora sp. NBRC 106375]|uniref:hypothetical protein n=1 Tax=Actinomycetospora sp. NBRC 106375 TaxID=3032207 RepID=UPI002553ADBF|nr:hypothetical protein [Actinomycetospora sp. NBRC 106375]